MLHRGLSCKFNEAFYCMIFNKRCILFLKALSSPSTSSSLSSSSSNNELPVQLQPHLLEQQQYLDLIKSSRNKDRNALDLITKFPANFSLNKLPQNTKNSMPNNLINQPRKWFLLFKANFIRLFLFNFRNLMIFFY